MKIIKNGLVKIEVNDLGNKRIRDWWVNKKLIKYLSLWKVYVREKKEKIKIY